MTAIFALKSAKIIYTPSKQFVPDGTLYMLVFTTLFTCCVFVKNAYISCSLWLSTYPKIQLKLPGTWKANFILGTKKTQPAIVDWWFFHLIQPTPRLSENQSLPWSVTHYEYEPITSIPILTEINTCGAYFVSHRLQLQMNNTTLLL